MNTPCQKIGPLIHAKLECLNLGGSHKVRPARQMIQDAELDGRLVPDGSRVLLEKTGGNLGIGLAIEANRRGYDLELVVPRGFSEHKKTTLKNYGVTLIGGSELAAGMTALEVIENRLSKGRADGRAYVYLDQFTNQSNVNAHRNGTGTEFSAYLATQSQTYDTKIVLVAGAGTGASLTGVGRALRNSFRNVYICAVQPEGCDLQQGVFCDHPIQGIAVGVKPPLLDFSLVNSFESCSVDDAVATQRWLVKKHGIFAGLSSSANIAVARRLESMILGSRENDLSCIIATLVYDSGESYMYDHP